MSIITLEEHGEILNIWKNNNFYNETIVIFDQHLDFKKILPKQVQYTKECLIKGVDLTTLNRDIPFREDNMFTYGLDSFLCMAGELNLLKKLIWVIPGVKLHAMKDIAHKIIEIVSLIPYEGQKVLESFQISENYIFFQLGGMDVFVTTLKRLGFVKDFEDAKVDIDLDYFADSFGNQLTDPALFVQATKELGLYDRIETMTFSISSGFLPESHRYLAKIIAGERCMESAARACHPAKQSVKFFASGEKISSEIYKKISQKELEALGGAGYSLRAVLALQVPNLSEAIKSYEIAKEMGDQASIAAYYIGLYYNRQKNFELASCWFGQASVNQIDSLHFHAQCLRALALSRLGRWEEAYHLGIKLLKVIPLRKQLYDLVSLAGEKISLPRVDQQKIKKIKQKVLNLVQEEI